MQNENEKFKKEFIQRLIRFSLEVIKLCEVLKKEKVFYSLLDQLLRSSTSIGANVVEAKSSSSKKDYINFFQIAVKSVNETKYWLAVIKEAYLSQTVKTNRLISEAIEISNILGAGIITMKGKK